MVRERGDNPGCDRKPSRWVFWKGPDTPVYARELLPAATTVQGPAIIEEMGSVTVVPPQWSFEVGSIGELLLTRRSDDKNA